MWRTFREWVLPLVVGAGLVAIAAALKIPTMWVNITWIAGAIGFSTMVWILSSGTIIQIATWLIPALLLVSAHLLYPTAPAVLALGFVLLLPVTSQLFAPIGRVFERYVVCVSGWIVPLTLPTRDRDASAVLRRAMIPDQSIRDGTLPTDDRYRMAGSVRAHAKRIRSVRAPDPEWRLLVEKFASALENHADYVEGRSRDDDADALAMLTDAKADFFRLLRSRSIGYRILAHQLVRQRSPASDAGGGEFGRPQ